MQFVLPLFSTMKNSETNLEYNKLCLYITIVYVIVRRRNATILNRDPLILGCNGKPSPFLPFFPVHTQIDAESSLAHTVTLSLEVLGYLPYPYSSGN